MSAKFDCPECGAILSDDAPPKSCPECGAGLESEVQRPARTARPSSRSSARRSTRVRAQDVRSANPSMAISGAIGGAIVGALLWAGIAYTTHYEVGWVAWGIGALVGGACVWLGGRGQGMAVLCAALSLVSILLGKILATQFLIGNEIEKVVAQQMSAEVYQDIRRDWTDLARLQDPISDEQLRAFMATHGYTEGDSPGEVTVEEIAAFRAQSIPFLRDMAEWQPDLEEWRDSGREGLRAQIPLMEVLKEDLSAFDLLWAFLGVSTAYGLLMKTTMQEAVARQRAARAERAESEED